MTLRLWNPLHFVPQAASICALLIVGVWPAFGQVDRAVLEGTVRDPRGSVVAGATVKVLAIDTGLSEEGQTTPNGYYRFPGLAVGRYSVTVNGKSFKTKIVDDVILRVGQTHTLDVELAPGVVTEKVEVHATNEPADRSSAEASTVIDKDQIDNLPNNGRDWSSLSLLAPFAQDDGGGDQRTIRFAGRARDDNNFQIDGVDAGGIQEQAQKSQTRLQISQDAIEEYRVNSALYDAEYGTQAGGQIDVETKHGTNDWHGGVFGYLRNSAFDARNFNDFNVLGLPAIPPFRYGQYGMTLGGPVKKDKLFFFINYEGLRQFGETTNQLLVPTAAVARGTLLGGDGINQNTNGSPLMCSILQAYPWRASTGAIGSCNPVHVYPDSAFADQTANGLPDSDLLTVPATTTVHEDTWLIRMDYNISDKTRLYGSAHRDISLVSGTNGSGSLPYDLLQTINHPAGYYIALQNTFSPRVVNEVKLFVNRAPFINPQIPPLPYSVQTNDWVGINNNQADHEVGTTYGIVDNLTWVHGRNTFKTGMEIRRVRLNQGLTAGNTLSFQDGASPSNPGFESAQLYGISYTSTWCCHKLRRTFYMPYFQDEWKVRPDLTLNLGIRWEYYGVAHEADNRTTVFDVTQFHGVCFGSGSTWRSSLPTALPTPINTPACPTNPALYNADYRNFDPRVSFAWAPNIFHGKTVIRSGFGIYHGAAQNDDLNAGLESDRYTAFAAFQPYPTPGTPLLPVYQQTNPDLSSLNSQGLATAEQPRALQRHGRRDLYVETWGLTVDRELPANFLASAQYLGSRGVRLFSRGGVNFCSSLPNGTNAAGNINCTRPLDQYYPGGDPFGSVDYKSDIGSSTYNALLLSLDRRLSNGLSLQGHYTWSHSINDGSVGGGESNGPENVNCLKCDKGPSVFDVRNNIAVNAVYELPFGPGKPFLNGGGLLGWFVGGWQMSSIGVWHTGHPLTVTMNISPTQLPDGNDQTTQRPDLVPGVPIFLPGGVQNHTLPINPAAFAPPPLDPTGIADSSGNCVNTCGLVSRFGSAPNGVIRALNVWQIDFALSKETKLTERVSMEFGAEVFNIFNHVQFGDPNPNNLQFNYTQATDSAGNPIPNDWILSPSGNLGLIDTTVNFNNNNDNAASPNTGTGLPRQIQVMLRFKF